MKSLPRLFEQNRAWAEQVSSRDPGFFERLAVLQTPQYLWIGCSDSRVPANEIVGLLPGELFVHRNVSNVVVHTDLNCLSVIQFAVEVLKVKHVIVCGHLKCGGVKAALEGATLGLIDNWLRHVQDVRAKHAALVAGAGADAVDMLCRLNAIEQALHVCETTVVQDAWKRGQPLWVHAWVYDLKDGLLRDLRFTAAAAPDVRTAYESAVAALR